VSRIPSDPNPSALAAACAVIEEAAAARIALPALANIARVNPAWMVTFDLTGDESAPMDMLLELLATAPTDFARGMAFARLSARAQELASDMGRITH
jgi:hypothetical protein